MNYKVLALGAALGMAFAAIPSCNSGKCGSGNCRGCCNAAGICINPGKDTACGLDGTACVACTGGRTCMNNSCVQVGSPCTSDTECASLSSAAVCKLATNPYGTPYPDGYCTKPCTTPCPADSFCVAGARRYGENDSFCWRACGSGSDCRAGYDCYQTTSGGRGCWLSPFPTPDAGPPAPPDLIGSPCAMDDDCRNPPFGGFCTPERNSSGNPTGYIGGYCSAPCDVGGEAQCGSNGTCVSQSTGSFCQRRCTNPGQGQGDPAAGGCRDRYVCATLSSRDGGTPVGFCIPNCSNPGVSCGQRVCRPTGYCT